MPVLGDVETGRLFEPAPEPMPGQTGIGECPTCGVLCYRNPDSGPCAACRHPVEPDRMERLRLGAERARAQRKTDAWSRALAETAETPCRCGLEHHSPETLRELGAGCTAPRYVCPRLDALRRRFGQ